VPPVNSDAAPCGALRNRSNGPRGYVTPTAGLPARDGVRRSSRNRGGRCLRYLIGPRAHFPQAPNRSGVKEPRPSGPSPRGGVPPIPLGQLPLPSPTRPLRPARPKLGVTLVKTRVLSVFGAGGQQVFNGGNKLCASVWLGDEAIPFHKQGLHPIGDALASRVKHWQTRQAFESFLCQADPTMQATYTVNEANKSFTVRFEGSSYPNNTGVEKTRPFTLTGDDLKIINPAKGRCQSLREARVRPASP
jgi:hypothetical protein